EKIDAIFSSDLKRAQDTCREVAKYHAVPIRYTKQLRKSDTGIYSGKPKIELSKAYEAAFASEGTDKLAFKPEGGESILEVKERVQTFFENLYSEYPDKTIVVITHGELVRILMHIYKGMPLKEAMDMKPEHAGITIIEVNKKAPINLSPNPGNLFYTPA